jgi:ketosteroid isomerase-like protein
MTSDSVAVLKGMYAAESEYLATGGVSFDPLAPYFHPDVVLHQAATLPYGGTWHGHDGIARFFVAMSATWSRFELGEQEFLATGDTVVVRTEVHATARATGRELRFPILQTITVQDGRISEVRPFYWDTAAVAAACTE